MDKFKFYIFKIHLSIEDVSNLLTSQNDEFYGIKFINKTESYLKFNFYENKVLETTFIDKDFKEHTIEYLKNDNFYFYIYYDKNYNILVLENPYRNLSFFKNFLSQKLLNKLSIININLNPTLLFDFLKNREDINITISSLEVKDIQLSKSTIATLTIKSSDNLVNNFQKYIQSENYIISKVLFTSYSKFKGRILLTHESSLSLQLYQQNEFLELFLLFLKSYLTLNKFKAPL